MPRLLRRIRRSLRPSRLPPLGSTANHSPRWEETHDDHFGRRSSSRHASSSGRSRASSPLPEITDRGPPTANRYSNADIFWNSVMMEAEPITRTVRRRNGTDNLKIQPTNGEGSSSKHDASDYSHLKHGQSLPRRTTSDGPRQPHGSVAHEEEPSILRHDLPSTHHGPSNHLRDGQSLPRKATTNDTHRLPRSFSYGRERADNDLDVMFYTQPNYNVRPMQDTGRSASPISPGTKCYDDFMDFPFTKPTKNLENRKESHNTILEDVLASEGLSNIEGKNERPIHSSTGAHCDSPEPVLPSWNAVLDTILANEHIDPIIRQAVLERIVQVSTANRGGRVEWEDVSAEQAGLVLNYNHLTNGNALYNRIEVEAEAASLLSLLDGLFHDGAGSAMPLNRSQEFNTEVPSTNGYTTPQLQQYYHHACNGNTSSTRSIASPLSTETSSHRDRTPPSSDDLSNQVITLLSMLLNPEEMGLLRSTLDEHYGHNQRDSFSNILTTSETLVCKLYDIITGLQDRVCDVEDRLLPQLSEALERKTQAIDILLNDLQLLGIQTILLKSTIDFGNSILAGCWAREYELWRTLIGIRQKREMKFSGVMGKLMSMMWETNTPITERVLLNNLQEKRSMTTDQEQRLLKRELDALILMAEQNLRLLLEDAHDMTDRVEECRRTQAPIHVPDAEPGSWRDV